LALTQALKKKKEPSLPVLQLPAFVLERVSFLLNRLGQRIRETTEEALKPYQITGKHVGVMTIIHERGSIQQNEIGLCMHIDRTTMVDVVDDLENKGLVERKNNPVDRRAYALVLTPKGKSILPRVQKLGMAAERRFLSHLNPKDQKELIGILQKLVRAHFTEGKA
jgi:DNA-binding MarR family transcriptional regulator